MKNKNYVVIFRIDVSAVSEKEAASLAWKLLSDKEARLPVAEVFLESDLYGSIRLVRTLRASEIDLSAV